MQQRVRISPSVVASLDAARALAAIYVVLHHVTGARGWHVGIGRVFVFGQEAVIAFFLLSGFVIFANERDRALAPGGYYRRRIQRIYPALIAAMLVSTAVAWDKGDLAARFSVSELFGTLAGLQDNFFKPGTIVYPYLDNDPLWSLSYELGFYLIFPLVLRAWHRYPRRTNHLVGAACCAAYVLYAVWPNHPALVAAYFMLWWCGGMAADAYLRGGSSVRDFVTPVGWLVSLCGVMAAVVAIVGHRGFSFYPMLPLRHLGVGLSMVLLASSAPGRAAARRCLPLARPAAWLASISYGLYVLHYPVLVDWPRAWSIPGLIGGALVLVALAWLSDHWLSRMMRQAWR